MKGLKRIGKFAKDHWLAILILAAIVGGILCFISPPLALSGFSIGLAFYPPFFAAFGEVAGVAALAVMSTVVSLATVGMVAFVKLLGDGVGAIVGFFQTRLFPSTIPQVEGQVDADGSRAKEEPKQNKVISFLKNHWLKLLVAGAIIGGVVCFFFPPLLVAGFAGALAADVAFAAAVGASAEVVALVVMSGIVSLAALGAAAFIKNLFDGVVKIAGCIKGCFSSKEKEQEPTKIEVIVGDSSASSLSLLGGRSSSNEEVLSQSNAPHSSLFDAAIPSDDAAAAAYASETAAAP